MDEPKSEELEREYHQLQPRATHFAAELERQILHLLNEHDIKLGVPLEKRVKEWDSIKGRLQRKSSVIQSVRDLPDLVGLRIILLFQRDVSVACKLIAENFAVIQAEDKRDSLQEREFGYASVHYIVKAPKSWLAVPTLAGAVDLRAEIQVRTLAQHIWAAASHTLQYKQEASVPPLVQRSINRVAALLETVDLEFERVLDLRTTYRAEIGNELTDGRLNVDLLARVLDETLPSSNRKSVEDYEDLLRDLRAFDIVRAASLRQVIRRHLERVLNTVNSFTDTGLVRQCLWHEFGNSAGSYFDEKYNQLTDDANHSK